MRKLICAIAVGCIAGIFAFGLCFCFGTTLVLLDVMTLPAAASMSLGCAIGTAAWNASIEIFSPRW